jgi:hypothetical protein
MSVAWVPRSAPLALAAAFLAATSAHADLGVVPLGSLIAQSDAIVIGVVDQVMPLENTPDGPHLARIGVLQTLKGNVGGTLYLLGDPRAPEDPTFVAEVRLLVFLRRAPPPPPNVDTFDEQPVPGWTVVGAAAGVIVLVDDGAAQQAATIVTRYMDGRIGPADFSDVLQRSDTRVPRPLVGSLLEELSGHVSPGDDGLVADMACNGAQVYLPAVQEWAVGVVGARRIRAARGCLEGLARPGQDPAFLEAAIDALGDLRDPGSVPALLTWLQVAMTAPKDGAARGGAGPVVGAVLALGKIGDRSAVPELFRLARQGDNLPLHSAIVHALGLIGGPTVHGPLTAISRTDPNPLVREQAVATLQRLGRPGVGRPQ